MAQSVAFRLEGELREKLDQEARARRLSAGQYARQLVVAALEGQAQPAGQELDALREEVARLRTTILDRQSAATAPEHDPFATADELAAIRQELLVAFRQLPKELALETHIVHFLSDYSASQRELLERNLAALRRDLANAVLALLVGAGKMTNDQANAWVNAHLRRGD